MTKAVTQYLGELKKALSCPPAPRRELLSRAGALLDSFWEENPDCSYEDLAAAFGPPELFTREMLDTLDWEKPKGLQVGQKWLLCGVAALAVVLMLTATFRFAEQDKPEPSKDEQVPKISVIHDNDPESPTIFAFGLSSDDLTGYLYWNHPSENSDP